MTKNLQADSVQRRKPLFVRYCLNLFLFGRLSCTGEYVHGTDIFGNEHFERRSTVIFADRILSGYDTADYPKLIKKLDARRNELDEYITAYEYKNAGFDMRTYQNASAYSGGSREDWADDVLSGQSLSYEQAKQKYEQLSFCIARLGYVLEYPYYAEYVSENSDNIITLSMVGPGSFAAENAVKTKRDFYGLEAIRLTAESDIGIISLFTDSVTDMIAVLCAVCSAAVIGAYMRKQTFFKGSVLLLDGLAVSAGIAVMYICNAALTDNFVGLPDLRRPIQSVQCFMTSSNIMNIGTLAALRIIFKAAACACVFFIVSGTMTASKKAFPVCAVIVFISAETILLFYGGAFSVINVFNYFRPERIFGVYGNLDIFGNAVSPQPVFVFTLIVMLAAALMFAMISASSGALCARANAENEYYNEVGRKYEETRKIRHDMNNHLTALGILINEGKITEAKTYLGELSAELSAQKPPAPAGRPVLDALLFGKEQTAANYGIKLDITVDAAFPESVSDYDLCGILGNVLDNAIEACEKYEGQKFIRLTVKKQMDMLCIFCENPYSRDDLSPSLETSKADKAAHGYGIRRIKQLAEKHGGMVRISAENELFNISILIQG